MHVLFDFDGTLVDSLECVMKKTILLADKFNFKKIDESQIIHLRDLPSKDIVKFLKIPMYKIPLLIHQMREHLHNEMPNLKPAQQIYPVVEKLFHQNIVLGIITSNSIENVTLWLEAQNMVHFFNFIHVESNLFSKKYLLKKTLKRYNIDRTEAYYICDETRDIDAAKKNNIKSIAVTWGYNSEAALLQFEPTFIAQNPEDILKIIYQTPSGLAQTCRDRGKK